MFAWLNGPGRAFREPQPMSTNYLGAYDKMGKLRRNQGRDMDSPATSAAEEEDVKDEGLSDAEKQELKEKRKAELEDAKAQQNMHIKPTAADFRPFPLNFSFKSEPVLSEGLREELWRQVVELKQSVATVSAVFGVDMRRVAAVVRLTTVEKEWVAKGEKLATPYASAVLAMLPQTRWSPTKKIYPHESINDLPVHPWTRQQIFYPTSESRHFTRADAAKVFSPTLLPADDRIPHPELVQLEREAANEVDRDQRLAAQKARDEKAQRAQQEKERKQAEWEAKNRRTVAGQRWDFNFTNISVEEAGKDGRGRRAVGWRYGNPHNDRKRGVIKIPTSVE
ncbi:hypothetical protein AAFC00_000136 [Neodothiora populina]